MLSPQEQLKELFAVKGQLVTDKENLEFNLSKINDQIAQVRQQVVQMQKQPLPPPPPATKKEKGNLVELAKKEGKKEPVPPVVEPKPEALKDGEAEKEEEKNN